MAKQHKSPAPGRSLVYSVAVSLDGFIAGPNGEDDWILMDPEIDFTALLARFDTILMGRRTYDGVRAKYGGGGGAFGMKTCVASRTLRPADHPGVEILGADLFDRVREMKRAQGKDIWLFGGGLLCASLLDAGLVDTLEFACIPVLLGQGTGAVAGLRRRRELVLSDSRVLAKTGTTLVRYRVPC
jgi:dihydrofolate reductase